jgi:DNA polymerase III delta prime subunit
MSSPTETKAIYLSHFTPSMMPAQTLEAMLVQREPLLSRALEHLLDSVSSGSRHHTLFVGPRGIGKTHLLSLLHHRFSTTTIATEKSLIAWMREEEWGVTSFFELTLRILRTLAASYPSLQIDSMTEAIYDLPIAEAENKAESILLEVLSDKCLVVLMENIDDLFANIGDHGQKAWRAFIQNHRNMVLVCTTPSLFAGVTIQKSAFYGFFDIETLDELSFDNVVNLLDKIAIERHDLNLSDYIKTPEGRARIRAVHHLAEGNPRIYIIFAQFLTRESLDELVQAFMHTLDELTPYYQARMKELSGQQRKLLEYLINYRGAATVKEIARGCFVTAQVCSSQLKQLRDKRYVRSTEVGRESYYELCEPLMRLCMEVKKQRGEPVSLFVEMLRIWYTEDQLRELLTNSDSTKSVDTSYLKIAIKSLENESVEPTVQAVLRDILNDRLKENKLTIFEDLIGVKTKNKSIKRFQSLTKLVLCSSDELRQLPLKEVSTLVFDVSELNTIANQLGTTSVGAILTASLTAGSKVFKHYPDLAKNIFRSLIPIIQNNESQAAASILGCIVDRRPSNNNESAMLALLNVILQGTNEEYALLLMKKIQRMSDAILANINSKKTPILLLKLAKEERALAQEIINLVSLQA